MYKYSPFDRKTNFMIAAACIGFFIYAQYSSPKSSDLELLFTGGNKKAAYELTAEEFREKFNSQSEELARQVQMKIDRPFEVTDKKFSHKFTSNLILSGKIGDENISEIEIFADPQNQDESFQSIVCIGLIISIFSPELDQDERSEIFNELKMFVDKSTANMNEKTVRGKIQYSLHTDENKKVTFKTEILGVRN